jgi:hypothetical protein
MYKIKKNQITGLKNIVCPGRQEHRIFQWGGGAMADTEDERNLCVILKIML